MVDIGSLVCHKSSGTIGIVIYISPDEPSVSHHVEVWIPTENDTRWWSKQYCEVICR